MLNWRGAGDHPSGPDSGMHVVEATVGGIGEADFAERLLAGLRGYVAAEHCSMFERLPSGELRCLGAASQGGSPIALTAASRYVASYWRDDPMQHEMRGARCERHAGVGRMTWDTLPDTAYRRECYELPGVIDRVSFHRDVDGKRYVLSIFRGRRVGFFAAGEVQRLAGVADPLTAMLAQHQRVRAGFAPRRTAPPPLDHARVERRLACLGGSLSQRELAVCARVVLGEQAETIAAALGLRVSSVITYRRRGYVKLGVASHAEMAALCLAAAEADTTAP